MCPALPTDLAFHSWWRHSRLVGSCCAYAADKARYYRTIYVSVSVNTFNEVVAYVHTYARAGKGEYLGTLLFDLFSSRSGIYLGTKCVGWICCGQVDNQLSYPVYWRYTSISTYSPAKCHRRTGFGLLTNCSGNVRSTKTRRRCWHFQTRDEGSRTMIRYQVHR